ncbi:unnamed protein product [Caenorhabditis auriculariae]|uniref:Uncharacterized protein n=1 Tax=Caenorhabditis auriculariae TaxID=2777116 RepID=A0A8S1H4H8_9PELO|nr:unnamed protein product [Caenorhabditis auriculariae]
MRLKASRAHCRCFEAPPTQNGLRSWASEAIRTSDCTNLKRIDCGSKHRGLIAADLKGDRLKTTCAHDYRKLIEQRSDCGSKHRELIAAALKCVRLETACALG